MMVEGYNKNKTLNGENKTSHYTGERHKINHHNESLRIAITYGIFGAVWILLSDEILDLLTEDPIVYKQLQSYKGWLYVFATTILVYILIRKRMRLMQNATNKTLEAYKLLKISHDELINMENELGYQKNFTQNIIDDAPVVIGIWDEEGKIKSLNPYGQKIFGYSQNELVDKRWIDLLIPQENKLAMNIVSEKLKQNITLKNHESQFISKDRNVIDILWNSSALSSINGKRKEVISIGVDITERKKYQESLRRMAFYDTLTGLPNRVMFENEVRKLINEKSEGNKFAIAYIDVDNFKYINDTFGHQVGDEFLKGIGNALHARIKFPNLVARLGGDEFTAVFTEVESNELLIKRIEEIKKDISRTWVINNHEFFGSISIGISIYPYDGDDITSILKNADMAMYTAKKEGKDRILLYKEYIKENNSWYVEMVNKIKSGIDNEEFILFYQPQFELNTGEILGAEVLVRWLHPTEGIISPAEFIPLAEETSQIYSIEQWIVKNALQQKEQWEQKGFSNIELSINLSSKTLTSDSNFREIEMLLDTFNIDYSKIVIEITETAIISNIDLVVERLNRLKERGIKIALDDFGTGYSSLTYLKDFPIDIIKLDRSFISLIPQDDIDTVIVKSILSLARDLNYGVVAEGIETSGQLEYLKSHYCESGQGFLLSKPLPEKKINELIKNSLS